MNNPRTLQLSECTEFRQTLMARPPSRIHATALVLVALLGSGLLWAVFAEADLIVRASGRIRPMTLSNRSADASEVETTLASLHGGRVVEVHVQEGQRVSKGDLLIRFDDRELQNEIAKCKRTIQASRSELTKLKRLKLLKKERTESAQAKAESELAQAEQELATALKRRAADIEIAEVHLASMRDTYERHRQLLSSRAVSAREVNEALTAVNDAQLKLKRAQIPVDQHKVPVLRRALELVARESSVEASDLEMKRTLKEAELDAAELELAKLNLRLSQSIVMAPSDGVVTSLEATVGSVLKEGEPALTLVDLRGFRLDIAITGDDVGDLREGMPVRIKLDAYDYQKYGTVVGTVVYISPDSEVNKQSNTPSTPCFTVRVALQGDTIGRREHSAHIKLGMTGQAEILTGKERLITLLIRSFRRRISLG